MISHLAGHAKQLMRAAAVCNGDITRASCVRHMLGIRLSYPYVYILGTAPPSVTVG